MKPVVKIAVIGSPGSGKSTLCSGLFYNLKILGAHVEMVPELVKYKVYKGNDFSQAGFDIQNTLEQKRFEQMFTQSNQMDTVICEAPLCNGYFYAEFYKKSLELPVLRQIAKESINTYDYIILVKRDSGGQYVEFGRKESEKEAKVLDALIPRLIKRLGYTGRIITVSSKINVLNLIKDMGILP